MRAYKAALGFLGHEFRFVEDRRDNYFQCGYPSKAFDKVGWYVRNRLCFLGLL